MKFILTSEMLEDANIGYEEIRAYLIQCLIDFMLDEDDKEFEKLLRGDGSSEPIGILKKIAD